MRCCGGTDYKENTFVINKMLTTKMPRAAVLMQLAVMLAERSLWLEAAWVPRDSNQEADALTNDRFEGFDPALRLEVDWAKVQTGVMSSLLEQGLLFEKEIAVRRDAKATALPTLPRRTAKRKREQRTPWEG